MDGNLLAEAGKGRPGIFVVDFAVGMVWAADGGARKNVRADGWDRRPVLKVAAYRRSLVYDSCAAGAARFLQGAAVSNRSAKSAPACLRVCSGCHSVLGAFRVYSVRPAARRRSSASRIFQPVCGRRSRQRSLLALQTWDYTVMVVASHAFEYFMHARNQELERAKLQQALAESQLQSLKSQTAAALSV